MNVHRTVTDVLIIGGGGAGLRAALAAREKGVTVTLACKELLARSGSTPLASWGYAASFGHNDPADSPRQHFLDTLREGRYLSDQDLVETLVQNAPACALDLERYGLKIKKQEDGRFAQISVPGETYPRSLIIEGGGVRIARVLRQELLKHRNVRILEDTLIMGLLQCENSVTGAWGYNFREGSLSVIEAAGVVIATGGHGALWGLSDNPPGNIGDGYYLAYQAGADLVDLEMMLYYPMVIISPPDAKGTLLDYEICLDGAFCAGKLLNSRGEEFIGTSPLPARDELMQAIAREVREGRGSPHGGVYLALSRSGKPKAEIEQYAGSLLGAYRYLKDLGVDIVRDQVEIAPAAHYALGGIRIDNRCRTRVDGLFAAGEVTGNIHGANRISGNALAETQVFGKTAGESAADYARACKAKLANSCTGKLWQASREEQLKAAQAKLADLFSPEHPGKLPPALLKQRVRQLMDQYVGYGRNEECLRLALRELQQMRDAGISPLPANSGKVFNLVLLDALEGLVMLEVAQLVCGGALARKETRGHHYRMDYPLMNEGGALHTVLSRDKGEMVVELQPVRRISEIISKEGGE
jgi:fumarate reductase (CoM/CoB) subunit A